MKWLVSLIVFLSPTFLFAEIQGDDSPSPEAFKEEVIDQRENYFLTSTDYRITPKVNPITGEYYEEETDLIVAGSQPLSLRRFYSHFAPYEPRYASWRYNPECYFVANLEFGPQEIFAAIGESDGSICSYKRSRDDYYTFNFEVSKSFTTFNPNGQLHPLNTKIQYKRLGDPKDKHRFQYIGTITDGSGRKRSFSSPMHRWTHFVHYTLKKRGFGWGYDITYRIQGNTWTPYQIPIIEEKLPNGNILCYSYTRWKDEKRNYPRPALLSAIVAYNSDKSKILGSIHFQYPRSKHDEVAGVQATGSDGRIVSIQHACIDPILLVASQRAGQSSLSYGFQNGIINKVEKPDGRLLTTEYQPGTRKVSAQYAPVGPKGEMCPIGRYEYLDKSTVLYDAEKNKTIYRYDENKKITHVEVYLGNTLYRTDRFMWEASTGNLLRKIIEDGNARAVQITEYQYDKNQNPIVEKLGDGNEWRVIQRSYSEDGFNLKLTEIDPEGKKVCYHYLPHTNLLASQFDYEGNTIRKRIFHTYDDCAIRIKTIIDDGISENPENLQGVTFRKIIEITPKQTVPCFGLPEAIEEKSITPSGEEVLLGKVVYTYTPFGKIKKEDHYDSQSAYCYSLLNEYDEKERLISKIDALGHETTFTYDSNHNLISISGPKQGQHKEISYDKANRPVRIMDLQIDGSILLTEKNYDKLGRVIEEIDACKNKTRFEYDSLGRVIAIYHPDGAIERKEYDVLGNITKEIDPLGYEIRKKYNAFGQPTSIYYPDGTEEHFTYNSNGKLHAHIDKNGANTFYFYDIFDHLIKTEIYSSSGQLLKITSSNWSAFHKLSETEGDLTIVYDYDLSGKKIGEKKANQHIHYAYDTLGRLSITREEDTSSIEEFDISNRVIQTRIEQSGKLQTKKDYAYDEANNFTHTIHSTGVTEAVFNTNGKPISIKDACGFITHFSYSYQNEFIQTNTNPRGIQTLLIHDSRGREAKCLKKNAKGEVIQQQNKSYDQNGNLTSLTHIVFAESRPIKSVIHRWEYGPLGRVERFIEAEEKETRYLYDEKGRLKTIIKPNGIELMHEYDELGRLSRFYGTDFDCQYTYDFKNRIIAVEDAFFKKRTSRIYDSLGCILQESLANDLTFTNIYDKRGRRIALILPDASKIEYAYDGIFLKSVSRNNYLHINEERNLEGEIIRTILPGNAGKINIERDPLGRYVSLLTPFYSAHYPKDSYDPNGNLTRYQYEDLLGKIECSYSYDDLDQLILENEHSYLFDSLHNRLKKDSIDYDVNSLCQITHEGNNIYIYDGCGNLISDGEHTYTYDSLDRLVAIEKEDTRIEYTYDPFHRRLSKTIFHKGRKIKSTRFMWDGDNEIGCVEDDLIKELRILGEGLGAEIGAAVLFELNGTTYLPIHDHRGCITTLIDLKNKKPVECYRYTAFGEELTNSFLSPWRFSSKRIEDTGLLYFGRRYYHPHLGRWITQDPEGFDAGPNLYAYLHNSPLMDCDLYGLFSMKDFSCPQFNPMGVTGNIMNFFGIGLPQDFPQFEDPFKNKSFNYSLNNYNFDLPELPVGKICFGNGINNKFENAKEKALLLSSFAGTNIYGTYNATHSLPTDVSEAFMNLISHTRTTPVFEYHKLWDSYFTNNSSGAPLLQTCHSQGAAQVRNALESYPKEKRDRIIVAAFAPFAYIPSDLCMKATHYVSDADFIPRIDFIGRQKCKDTIIHLKRDSCVMGLDHDFNSPTYLPYIKYEIDFYLKLLKNYVN